MEGHRGRCPGRKVYGGGGRKKGGGMGEMQKNYKILHNTFQSK